MRPEKAPSSQKAAVPSVVSVSCSYPPVLDFFARAGGSIYRFLCFFRFLWAKEIKKDKGAHLRFSKMCSLARFYYSGNRKRKSTAITAKLFIFLIDIFSKIHKPFAFDAVSGSKASVCPASARLCRRHVRQGSASQSQYIYLQAKHSVLADGCALRVSGTGAPVFGSAAF